MKKLIIIAALIAMTGCAGYKVVYTCDKYRCFHQAVMPWQEAPEELFGKFDNVDLSKDKKACQELMDILFKATQSKPSGKEISCKVEDYE